MTNSTLLPYHRKVTPYELIKEGFDDTLCEADEYITLGELTAGEVLEAFAQSMIESQKYFEDKVKVYESLRQAIQAGGK